jgi:hypothetical protein
VQDLPAGWEDLRFPASSVRSAAGKEPTWTDYKSGQVLAFADQAVAGNEETIFFNVQLPHGWRDGTNLIPHVHWVGEDDTAGNVRWALTYSWANFDAAFGAATEITVDDANAATDVHNLATFAEISGSGKTFSSMLVCSLRRNSSHANDTLTGKDAYLLEVDFHYQHDSLGTRTATSD